MYAQLVSATPTGQRAAVARRRPGEGRRGTVPAAYPTPPRHHSQPGASSGYLRAHAHESPSRRRPAGLAAARRVARRDRTVHRPVDPREDRRPGRARQRRAPRALRRALAADVLADGRRRAGARAPGSRPARAPLTCLQQRAEDPEADDAPQARAPVVSALVELQRPRARADPARRDRHAPPADGQRAARAGRLAEAVVLDRPAVEAVVAGDRGAGGRGGHGPPRRVLARGRPG